MKPWEAIPARVTQPSGYQRIDLRAPALRQRLEPLSPSPSDLVAGLSVFLVLIPQGLAYAELAGLPSHLGLLAGTIPSLVAALFVSSPYLQTGPTALTALLVLGALSQLATPGSESYLGLAALLALLVGIARMVFGVLRLGIAAYFVSQPVLTGFTTGAALLIAGTQVPTIFGVDVARTAADGGTRSVMARALDAVDDPGLWNARSIIVAAVTLGLTLGLRRVHKLFPSVLVAVGAAWALDAAMGSETTQIGSLPSELPSFSFDLPFDRTGDLIVPALLIAMVGFVEPASICRTYATAKRERWSANQEFISQGVANVAAAATGTFPVGGSFGRSSLNERAGAQSRWSGAITGLTMLAFLPFTGVLETIPRAALAAVVVSAAISLVRLDRIAAMWNWSKPQMGTAVATLIATLALDPRIDHAIEFGIILSVGVHLWREMQVFVSVRQIDDTTLWVHPHGVIWFGSTNRIIEHVLAVVADHEEINRLVISLDGVGRLDLTAAIEMADFANDQRANGVEVDFESVPPHAKRLFDSLIDRSSPSGNG
jgi:SulP family sulfate permease